MATTEENVEKIIRLLKGSEEDFLQAVTIISSFESTEPIFDILQQRIVWQQASNLFDRSSFLIDGETVSLRNENDLLLLWIQNGYVDPMTIQSIVGNASSSDVLAQLLPLLSNLERFQKSRVDIPKEITQCGKLKYIFLAHIPEWIGEIPSLRSIHATYTSSIVLPQSIMDLPNIAFLDLWGSRISYIPLQLVQKESIKHIRFTGINLKYSFLIPKDPLYHKKVVWSKPMKTMFPRFSKYRIENMIAHRLEKLGVEGIQE